MNHQRLKSLLIKHEGLRTEPYQDSVGKWTIGVGRNLSDRGLSQDEIDYLLDADIDLAERELRERFSWFEMLSDPRQEVLINMCFNLGIQRLLGFKNFLKAVENGNYLVASTEMLDSRWAKQVGQRALELANIMQKGRYGD